MIGKHIPALDGIRGCAAVLVVLSHLARVGLTDTAPQFSGPAGVLLFFVLSGFLMGHLYLWKPMDRPAIVRYLIARIARVVPIYYIVVITAFFISQFSGPDFIYYMSAMATFKQLLFVGSSHVFWSIPPEFQFYFVFVGIWGLVASGKAVKYLPAVLFVFALIFLARPVFPGITVFSHLHIFLTGIAVALIRRRMVEGVVSQAAVSFVQIASTLAVVFLLISPVNFREMLSESWQHDGAVYGHIPIALVVGCSILSFSIDTAFARFVFGNWAVRQLGAISFSLYLLHEPVMDTARRVADAAGISWPGQMVIAFASALAAAVISYRFLEMPLQNIIRGAATKFLARKMPAPVAVM